MPILTFPEQEAIEPEPSTGRTEEVEEEEVKVNEPVVMPSNDPVSHMVIILSEPFECQESIEDLITQEALFEFDFREMTTDEAEGDIDDAVVL